MNVCVYTRVVHVCIGKSVHSYVCMHECVPACECQCMHVCLCTCAYLHLYRHMCMGKRIVLSFPDNLIHWVKFSQSNPELINEAGLPRQLPLQIPGHAREANMSPVTDPAPLYSGFRQKWSGHCHLTEEEAQRSKAEAPQSNWEAEAATQTMWFDDRRLTAMLDWSPVTRHFRKFDWTDHGRSLKSFYCC